MSADPVVQDAAPSSAEGVVAQAGPSENERGGDATVSAPRRRAPSPISTRQDPNRPFAFKRQSSGFTSFMNSIASPTSEVRTRPATPAESATRSTFFTGSPAIPDAAPTSAAPVFSVSPLPAQQDLELPAAPALQLRGPSPLPDEDEDRPKGQGTLELERVLGMWAAKTSSSSSFPSLPSLPSASSSTAANAGAAAAPLFAQAVVTAEPESLDLASSSAQQQPSTASTSSSLSSVFADFAQLAALQPTASASRDLLDLPRPPRRQRSKSEADIISMDFSNLGTLSFAPASQDGGAALDQNRGIFPPSSSQPPSFTTTPSYPTSLVTADGFRPPSAPSGYGPAASTPATADALQLESYDLALRARPTATHQRIGGGPGYREAALLDVGGGLERGRRAKSQGVGHRRSAKSDDFTHLFSQSIGGNAPLGHQQQHPPSTYTMENGHLAPPGGAPVGVAPPQRVLPPFSTGSSSAPGGPASSPHLQHQVYYVPNGQSVPIQVAYVTSIDPATGQSMLTPVPQPQQPLQQQHHQQHHLQQQQQQQGMYLPRPQAHPQYSPQGNALALAAAQAAQAHAASVAQAAVSAASSSSMPYSNGAAPGQRRPSAGRLSVASTAGSSHSPGGVSPGAHSAYGAPRVPFSYRSPVTLGLPALPNPPPSVNGLSPGGPSSGRSGAGGARKRSRASAVAAAAALKREEDEDEDEGDAEGEEDADMRDEYDDDEADYEDDGRAEPSLRAPAVFGKGRKKASGTGGGKKGAKLGARTAGNFADDDEDEFTKESKTTQATIDAAKRRRNAGAVAKFVCELCGETFTRRYNLRGHQRAHKGEKPYRCSQEDCDKSFARAHDCKRHELLHLGVRKYNCAPCKRDFVRLDALHRHHRSEVGQECVKKLQADGAKFDDKGAQIL
ncbi:hypothetical protein JCM8208_004906 [Rhodotorula glutinis]